MAILDLPTELIVSEVDITHSTPQFVTTSLSKKRRAKSRGIHQLKGTFKVTVNGDRQQRKFDSWLLGMEGRLNQFNLVLGNRFNVDTSRLAGVRLNANANIGAVSLSIAGFSGEIYDGDYFTMPNDSKVYMARNDLSGTTGGNIAIHPPLRQTQFSGTSLKFDNISILAQLNSDEQMVSYTEGGLITEYTCNWEEYV